MKPIVLSRRKREVLKTARMQQAWLRAIGLTRSQASVLVAMATSSHGMVDRFEIEQITGVDSYQFRNAMKKLKGLGYVKQLRHIPTCLYGVTFAGYRYLRSITPLAPDFSDVESADVVRPEGVETFEEGSQAVGAVRLHDVGARAGVDGPFDISGREAAREHDDGQCREVSGASDLT